MIETQPEVIEKVVLVGVAIKSQKAEELDEYLDELEFLASTAGGVTEGRFIQRLQNPDQRFFIGSGKLDEIKTYNKVHDIDTVIFDEELSPAQQRNLERELKCKILDRTSLILDIFAQRAQTKQATTQVELAQMQYFLPRLKGLWSHLERQRGGIGMRGPGEKEIETDKRIVQDKIAHLKKELIKLDKQNKTQRKTRGDMIRVALVGYTNVGKSTIMNMLSKKEDVLAENKLFATLDTTVRKIVIDKIPLLLSDTVGFIRKLPHNLVESFKSTLDEAIESDILAHVVDASHPNFHDQIKVVNTTLQELGAIDIPTIMVFNKMDAYVANHFDPYLPDSVKEELLENFKVSIRKSFPHKCVFISAIDKDSIHELREVLALHVQDLYYKRYPYANRSFH
ncbi:MAG: GTPase HflX [Bacteroidetes bacterium]|nr:GTPase HflX [Bacteroidota bacterium]